MSYVQNKLENPTDSREIFFALEPHPLAESARHTTANGQYQSGAPKMSEKSGRSSLFSEIQSQIRNCSDVSKAAEKSPIEATSSDSRLVNRSADSGVQSNLSRYLKWLEKSANEGITLAQISLAEMYVTGQGVPQDWTQAAAWFLKAAEHGDARAQYELGMMYLNGRGFDKDFKQAQSWFSKAARQGNASAHLELGRLYLLGQGVTRDFQQAVVFFLKAAQQGNASAYLELGRLYLLGKGVKRDFQQAATFFLKAAKLGNVSACYELGRMHSFGHGFSPDAKRAATWYRKAAEWNHPRAQYELGRMYFSGDGVKQDFKQAEAWLLKAAERDYPAAQSDLAGMYFRGEGVTMDINKSVYWFSKLAEKNVNRTAKFELSKIYSTELAGKKDLNLSTYLLLKSGLDLLRQEIEIACTHADELFEYIPGELAAKVEFNSVKHLKLWNFRFNGAGSNGLDYLIRSGTALERLSVWFSPHPEDVDIHVLFERLVISLREENTRLTHLSFNRIGFDNPVRVRSEKNIRPTNLEFNGIRIDDAVTLQIEQLLHQNKQISQLRQYLENHRPLRSDDLPLEVLMLQVDKLIVSNIRRGESVAFTRAAIDELLMSAQRRQLQGNTVHVN